jgi:GT2 family glycosyltransferase
MIPVKATLRLLAYLDQADILAGRAMALGTDPATGSPVIHPAAFDQWVPGRGFTSVPSTQTQPTPIVACGMACTLIHRRVLEHNSSFRLVRNEKGVVEVGEDIAFTHAAHQAGFRLLYVPEAAIDHRKSVDLGFVEASMDRAYQAGLRSSPQPPRPPNEE